MLPNYRYAPLTLRLRSVLRLRSTGSGQTGSGQTGAPGHGEHRGQRWGVLRQTQGRRTWASLGEAVFRQILQGGALSATILQRGRSKFPYPQKGGRSSLYALHRAGGRRPPALLTSKPLGRPEAADERGAPQKGAFRRTFPRGDTRATRAGRHRRGDTRATQAGRHRRGDTRAYHKSALNSAIIYGGRIVGRFPGRLWTGGRPESCSFVMNGP